ncbi:MAG: glycosyltransferase family 39 protein [Planctomycetes bacterium]|nr:glycosyltransferase family 39 protein [Planctomycetota bacterium]
MVLKIASTLNLERLTPARELPYLLGEASAPAPSWSRAEIGWVALLATLALVLRLALATKIDVVCADGILYIQLAEAWEQGNRAPALMTLGWNVYPMVLSWLHRAGLEWSLAGKVWGIATAVTAILPLYCWLRWQFDRRVAAVAVLLYATHPKLIEWSPELMRDSTFWMFATTSVYLAWRAACTGRAWNFALLAGALFLAQHTRFEGWFLFAPALLWVVYRAWDAPAARRAMLRGMATLFAVQVALFVLLNSTVLAGHSQSRWVEFQRLAYVPHLFDHLLYGKLADQPTAQATAAPTSANGATPTVPATEPATPLAPQPNILVKASQPLDWSPESLSFGKLSWIFVHTMRRGLDAAFSLLMFAGLWKWRHIWLRRDNQAPCVAALLVTAGAIVHLHRAGESSSRYSLLIVILASPFAALALMSLAATFARAADYLGGSLRGARLAYFGTIATVLCFGFCSAMHGDDLGRHRSAELGRWLKQTLGKQYVLNCESDTIALHYSGWRSEKLPRMESIDTIGQILQHTAANCIAITPRRLNPSALNAVMRAAEQAGFHPLDEHDRPAALRDNPMVILMRQPLTAKRVETSPR